MTDICIVSKCDRAEREEDDGEIMYSALIVSLAEDMERTGDEQVARA